jgi:hypothetical protein
MEILENLSEMLQRPKHVSNEEIFAVLEKTYPPDAMSSSTFVRALTRAIFFEGIIYLRTGEGGIEKGEDIIK